MGPGSHGQRVVGELAAEVQAAPVSWPASQLRLQLFPGT